MSGFLQKPGGDSESSVLSVNGQTGDVLLTTDDISEGSTNLYYSASLVESFLATVAGEPNGLATLDENGKIPSIQVPAIAITDTFVVADQTARLALSATVGDVAIQLDNTTTYILQGNDPTDNADWQVVITPLSVTSVNGQIGTVILTTDNIAEGSTNKYFTGVSTDNTLSGDGQDTDLTVNSVNDSKYAIAVYVATTAALANTPTYDNGVDGVGATLTRTGNGAFPSTDGVAVPVGSKVLVKNQASQIQNGVYVLTQSSSGTPWILTRDTSSDTTNKVHQQLVIVEVGTTNAGNSYRQSTANPVIGTNNIVYTDTAGTVIRQAATGTQAVDQIPLYSATLRTLTRGVSGFKYNDATRTFTIGGVPYIFPIANASGVFVNNGTGTISFQSIASLIGYTPENAANKNTSTSLGTSDEAYPSQNAVKVYTDTGLATKQATLVSGTNIKTINGNSLLGAGDIVVSGVATVTRGTPTQSGTATGQLQFNSVVYDEVNTTEFTVGTLGSGGVKYKFYDSRTDPAPSSPTVGLDISVAYDIANVNIQTLAENAQRLEVSDKATDFDTTMASATTIYVLQNPVIGKIYYDSSNSTYIAYDLNDSFETNFPFLFNKTKKVFGNPTFSNTVSSDTKKKITLTGVTLGDLARGDELTFSGGSIAIVYTLSPDGTEIILSSIIGDTPVATETVTNAGTYTGTISAVADTITFGILPLKSGDFQTEYEYGDDLYLYQPTQISAYKLDYDGTNISLLTSSPETFAVNDLVMANQYSANPSPEVQAALVSDVIAPSDVILNGETITLGSKTYTFQDTLTNVDGNVKVGADDSETLQNLKDAVNLTGTPGTQYATAMTIHPTLTATTKTDSNLVFNAKTPGTTGNGISISDTIDGLFILNSDEEVTTETSGGTQPLSGSNLLGTVNINDYYSFFAFYNGIRVAASASGNNINLTYTVPGVEGNSVTLVTSNPTAVAVSGPTLTGGNTSGTSGIIGEYRLGFVVGTSIEQTFLCVGTGVWKNLSNSSTPYTWTAA